MNETAEAKGYYEAAEAAFIRRRGTPFLLSPEDFALLKQWRSLGVPLEAIEAGIDEAFTRREERSAIGRVNSLSYCRDAVLEAWERRAETSRGKGGASAGPEPDARAALAELSRRLEESRRKRPDLDAPLGSALRSLGRLEESGKSSEEVESSLARLDRRLAKELYEAMSDAERAEIDREVAALLLGASARMDPAAADKTTRTLTRRSVRERLELPRLSLL
jgi:DNA-binding transcriptional MerR regulator